MATGSIDDYSTLNCLNSVNAGRGVSAEEIDQIISTTADDINFITPVLYTARPDLGDTERYPASAGWDPFFGYGRVNADRMVTAVTEDKIPPEADITSPKWFATVDPGAGLSRSTDPSPLAGAPSIRTRSGGGSGPGARTTPPRLT